MLNATALTRCWDFKRQAVRHATCSTNDDESIDQGSHANDSCESVFYLVIPVSHSTTVAILIVGRSNSFFSSSTISSGMMLVLRYLTVP